LALHRHTALIVPLKALPVVGLHTVRRHGDGRCFCRLKMTTEGSFHNACRGVAVAAGKFGPRRLHTYGQKDIENCRTRTLKLVNGNFLLKTKLAFIPLRTDCSGILTCRVLITTISHVAHPVGLSRHAEGIPYGTWYNRVLASLPGCRSEEP